MFSRFIRSDPIRSFIQLNIKLIRVKFSLQLFCLSFFVSFLSFLSFYLSVYLSFYLFVAIHFALPFHLCLSPAACLQYASPYNVHQLQLALIFMVDMCVFVRHSYSRADQRQGKDVFVVCSARISIRIANIQKWLHNNCSFWMFATNKHMTCAVVVVMWWWWWWWWCRHPACVCVFVWYIRLVASIFFLVWFSISTEGQFIASILCCARILNIHYYYRHYFRFAFNFVAALLGSYNDRHLTPPPLNLFIF